MIVVCPACARRYKLDPGRLGGRTTVTVRCPGCGTTSSVEVAAAPPGAAAAPAAAGASAPAAAAVGGAAAETANAGTASATAEAAGDQTARLAADAGLVPDPARIVAGEPVLPAGMRVTLAVLEGKDSGRMFRVERPSIVIGRGEGDIQLDDAEVSRRHVRLTVHDTRVVLHDLGSTNGTFVEETKISESAIENRAEFRVGATRLMLILSEESEPAAGGPS